MFDDDEIKTVLIFAISLMVYLTFGLKLLNYLVISQGILIAFPIFLGIYMFIAYNIGRPLNKGYEALLVLVGGFIIFDIITPPILVPFSGVTVLQPVQTLAADVFFYTVYTKLHFPHILAWIFTYLVSPILVMILLAFELSERKFSEAIRGAF